MNIDAKDKMGLMGELYRTITITFVMLKIAGLVTWSWLWLAAPLGIFFILATLFVWLEKLKDQAHRQRYRHMEQAKKEARDAASNE